MPGMSGWQVAEAVKELDSESGRKTPFILLTGWSGQANDREKYAKYGIDAVIEKPVNLRHLLEVIERVVNKNEHGV
jgi:CheY-like chemotaxis protein